LALRPLTHNSANQNNKEEEKGDDDDKHEVGRERERSFFFVVYFISMLVSGICSIKLRELLVNNELERMWKEAVMALLKNYQGISLKGLRKTMKNLRTACVLAETGIEDPSEYKSRASPM
jgi:hypothetical protein